MNWEQLKKNIGWRVQLVPSACRLDDLGRKLPMIDDDWIIQQISVDSIEISNTRTHHFVTLGKDHIYRFTSNPGRSRGDLQYGFLTLNVQLFIKGLDVRLRPNTRPGDSVEPAPPVIEEKFVDATYPSLSGIQARIENQGYRVAWCLDLNLARKVDLEGWEVVVEPDERGVPTKYKLQDRPANQTLVKKRM